MLPWAAGKRPPERDRQAASPIAYLGSEKMWGWCSCSIKRGIKNRRYLGHMAAESNEDGFPEGLPVLKCGKGRAGFGCVCSLRQIT